MKAFENIVGKGENVFSPFPTMFSTIKDINHHFNYFQLLSANAFNLDQSKILSFGKRLICIDICVLTFT